MVQKIRIVMICPKGLSQLLGLVLGGLLALSTLKHYDESVVVAKFIERIVSQVSLGL